MHVASFLKVGEGVKLIRNFDTFLIFFIYAPKDEGGGGNSIIQFSSRCKYKKNVYFDKSAPPHPDATCL